MFTKNKIYKQEKINGKELGQILATIFFADAQKIECEFDLDDFTELTKRIDGKQKSYDDFEKYKRLISWVELEQSNANNNFMLLLSIFDTLNNILGLTLDHEISIYNFQGATFDDPIEGKPLQALLDVGLNTFNGKESIKTFDTYRDMIRRYYTLFYAHNKAFDIMAKAFDVPMLRHFKVDESQLLKATEIYRDYLEQMKEVISHIPDDDEKKRRERIVKDVFAKPFTYTPIKRQNLDIAKTIAPHFFDDITIFKQTAMKKKFTEGYILGNK